MRSRAGSWSFAFVLVLSVLMIAGSSGPGSLALAQSDGTPAVEQPVPEEQLPVEVATETSAPDLSTEIPVSPTDTPVPPTEGPSSLTETPLPTEPARNESIVQAASESAISLNTSECTIYPDYWLVHLSLDQSAFPSSLTFAFASGVLVTASFSGNSWVEGSGYRGSYVSYDNLGTSDKLVSVSGEMDSGLNPVAYLKFGPSCTPAGPPEPPTVTLTPTWSGTTTTLFSTFIDCEPNSSMWQFRLRTQGALPGGASWPSGVDLTFASGANGTAGQITQTIGENAAQFEFRSTDNLPDVLVSGTLSLPAGVTGVLELMYAPDCSPGIPFPPTSVPSETPTLSSTPTDTATSTATRTFIPTSTATSTATDVPTETATDAPTETATASSTPTNVATETETATSSPTATSTASATETETVTTTPTSPASETVTASATPSKTTSSTPTDVPTNTTTATSTPTETASNTATASSSTTATATPTDTATNEPTHMSTPTTTDTATTTSTPTNEPTHTSTSTSTATASATPTVTAIATWSGSTTIHRAIFDECNPNPEIWYFRLTVQGTLPGGASWPESIALSFASGATGVASGFDQVVGGNVAQLWFSSNSHLGEALVSATVGLPSELTGLLELLYAPNCLQGVPVTATSMPTETMTANATATETASSTITATGTATETATPSSTATDAPTETATASRTSTPPPTETATEIPTETATHTPTATSSATETITPSETPTETPSSTSTPGVTGHSNRDPLEHGNGVEYTHIDCHRNSNIDEHVDRNGNRHVYQHLHNRGNGDRDRISDERQHGHDHDDCLDYCDRDKHGRSHDADDR